MTDPATPEPVSFRIATWNLNHWRQPLLPVDTRRGAWTHLADSSRSAAPSDAERPGDIAKALETIPG